MMCAFKILIKMGVLSKYKDITAIPSTESKDFLYWKQPKYIYINSYVTSFKVEKKICCP